MVEKIPNDVDSALLYFHTAGSTGDEIIPFLEDICRKLPTTYIWAGDGVISGSPQMKKDLEYGCKSSRYWFAFPMQDSSNSNSFKNNIESMGAVLVSCGAYINGIVDQIKTRFNLLSSRIVLCGHQHGSCVALAASMIRKNDPFSLTILFDPFPLETFYLKDEKNLLSTRIICIDNKWQRDRRAIVWQDVQMDKVFDSYGMNAESIALDEGQKEPDAHMFRVASDYIRDYIIKK